MATIEIQLAQKCDSKKVSELFKVIDTEHACFSKLTDMIGYIKKKQCFVAVQSGKIVGAIILREEDRGYEIYLIRSTVKGGGKVLIEFAKKKCKQDKMFKLWCWSLIRYKAKGFYKKMGFEEIFLLKQQWHGEDCYFFGHKIK
ncbi:MAG: GNAT family N-acetyltransferase [Candidatus Magasanikbacteria bacterium]